MARRGAEASLGREEYYSRSERRISNGTIVCETRSGPKGYDSKETFIPDKGPNVGSETMSEAVALLNRR